MNQRTLQRLAIGGVLWMVNGLLPGAVMAAVPHLVRYQGQAVDSQGVPLQGPYTLTSRLYDAETGGAIVWQEIQANVPITKGHFSILLGQVTALNVDWSQPCWLSTQIGSDPELLPRQRITSVPLALVAEQLDGPLHITGTMVGVGTTSPEAALEIAKDIAYGETAVRITNTNPMGNNGRALETIQDGKSRIQVYPDFLSMRDDLGAEQVSLFSYGAVSAFFRNAVGIGTTALQAKLQIDSDLSGGTGLKISNTGSGNNGNALEVYDGSTSTRRLTISAGGHLSQFNQSGTQTVLIPNGGPGFLNTGGNFGLGTSNPQYPLHMGNGAYVSTGGVWTDASSIQYKQDVAPLALDQALQTLQGLDPVTFRYIADPAERHVGFVAEAVPSLIATSDRKGLSAMDLVGILTKVVQYQQQQLEAQQHEMNVLKAQVASVKAHE